MGLLQCSKSVFGSIHVVAQLSFCLCPSILIFVFLNFVVIFYFLGPQLAIFGVG